MLQTYIDNYNFIADEIEYRIKDANGNFLKEFFSIALSSVWDQKICIFNNVVFQLAQDKERAARGIRTLLTEKRRGALIQFPRIPPCSISKQYTYEDFLACLTNHLPAIAIKSGFNVENSDLFEHCLLALADIDSAAIENCKFSSFDSDCLIVKFKLRNIVNLNQLMDRLNKQFGMYIAVKSDESDGTEVATIPYCVLIEDILPEWKKAVEKLLSNPSTLKTYCDIADQRNNLASSQPAIISRQPNVAVSIANLPHSWSKLIAAAASDALAVTEVEPTITIEEIEPIAKPPI